MAPTASLSLHSLNHNELEGGCGISADETGLPAYADAPASGAIPLFSAPQEPMPGIASVMALPEALTSTAEPVTSQRPLEWTTAPGWGTQSATLSGEIWAGSGYPIQGSESLALWELTSPAQTGFDLAEGSRDTEIQAWSHGAGEHDPAMDPGFPVEKMGGEPQPAAGGLLAASPATAQPMMATQNIQTAEGGQSFRTGTDRLVPYEHVPVQIVHLSAQLGEQGSRSMRLRLDPPYLGEIQLHVEASDQGITVRIVAQSGEACALLADQRQHLKEELGRGGLTLQNFTTSVAADGRDSAQQHDRESQTRWLIPGSPERERLPANGNWGTASPGEPSMAATRRGRRGLDTRV
jgi:hypothetical protein